MDKDFINKIAFDNRLNPLYQYLAAVKESGVELESNIQIVNELLTDMERLMVIVKEMKAKK